MIPVVHPIDLIRGGGFSLDIQCLKYDGTPADLTGYLMEMQMRPSPTSNKIYFTLTAVNGLLVIDLAGAWIRARLTRAMVDTVRWTAGTWDLRMIPPAGEPFYLIKGDVKVSIGTTR
jgi:hypothetical protein